MTALLPGAGGAGSGGKHLDPAGGGGGGISLLVDAAGGSCKFPKGSGAFHAVLTLEIGTSVCITSYSAYFVVSLRITSYSCSL